jgi:selenoprotein W-related protein
LAARIREEFSVEPRLVKGDNGVFDVVVDGKLVFSKHEVGRFPEEGEVLEALHGA